MAGQLQFNSVSGAERGFHVGVNSACKLGSAPNCVGPIEYATACVPSFRSLLIFCEHRAHVGDADVVDVLSSKSAWKEKSMQRVSEISRTSAVARDPDIVALVKALAHAAVTQQIKKS